MANQKWGRNKAGIGRICCRVPLSKKKAINKAGIRQESEKMLRGMFFGEKKQIARNKAGIRQN